MMGKYTLVLDVGTTAVKALLFGKHENLVGRVSRPLSVTRPRPGWVEQDPVEMVEQSRAVLREVLRKSEVEASHVGAMGIANQRETVVVWDKESGRALYPAIVWQDDRTQEWCDELAAKHEPMVRERTGLKLEPYFSGSSLGWLLKNEPATKQAAERGGLAAGTVDSWIMWNLLEGEQHVTDITNASRTMLWDVREGRWSEELANIFNVPLSILPEVRSFRGVFGTLKEDVIGRTLRVTAVMGDQQASLYAAGVKAGTTKVTYGTGTFVMQILDNDFSLHDSFYTTVGVGRGKNIYALEAKVKRGGRELKPLLGNKLAMENFIIELAYKVDKIVKSLPVVPKELVVDGGVARDEYVERIQGLVSDLPIRKQVVFDGTGLGIARLARERRLIC